MIQRHRIHRTSCLQLGTMERPHRAGLLKRLLRAEPLEPRWLLAAHLSPSPTILPILAPETAVALRAPIMEESDPVDGELDHEHDSDDGHLEDDFPFIDADDGDQQFFFWAADQRRYLSSA